MIYKINTGIEDLTIHFDKQNITADSALHCASQYNTIHNTIT